MITINKFSLFVTGKVKKGNSIIPRTTANVEAKRAKVNENGAATKIACDFKSRIYRTYKEPLSCM